MPTQTKLRDMPVRTVAWPILRTLWHGDTLILNAVLGLNGDGVTMRRGIVAYSEIHGGVTR